MKIIARRFNRITEIAQGTSEVGKKIRPEPRPQVLDAAAIALVSGGEKITNNGDTDINIGEFTTVGCCS